MSWSVVVSKFLHDLYFSPIIIQVTKSREERLAGHVAYKWVATRTYEFLVGNLK